MARKRIFITVKTYPTISKKYAELVCTAGILEDGSWIRIYPLPFRRLEIDQKFKKYSWVEVNVERNEKDLRPETYRVLDWDSIKIEAPIKNWNMRRQIIFNNKKAYTSLDEIIVLAKDKNSKTSLALFKPAKVFDFVWEETERDWSHDKLESLEAEAQMLSLFQTPEEVKNEFRVVPKVPYKFSYRFSDDSGKESKMMIEDWEIGMLYFNCLKRANGSEEKALLQVKQKYFDEFLSKDLYFFLGTTKKFHNIAPNPFIIIGVFYPPKNDTPDLFGGELC
jgi:hypothetical protein